MYLGEKDFQQAFIIKKMVNNLNMRVKVHIKPTLREADGLAMSSRNIYLSNKERQNALCLNKSLMLAQEYYEAGKNDISLLRAKMETLISENNGVLDYIAFINENTLFEEERLTDDTRVLIACKVGETRLIDNLGIRNEELGVRN
jgi:pantoate--beta-alanine ligase